MDKLTREQEVIVRKLLHYSKSEEFSQFILKTIEEHNWTRDMRYSRRYCRISN